MNEKNDTVSLAAREKALTQAEAALAKREERWTKLDIIAEAVMESNRQSREAEVREIEKEKSRLAGMRDQMQIEETRIIELHEKIREKHDDLTKSIPLLVEKFMSGQAVIYASVVGLVIWELLKFLWAIFSKI